MRLVELGLVVAVLVLSFHGWLISRLNSRLFEVLFLVRELPSKGFIRDGIFHPMSDISDFGDLVLVDRLDIAEILAYRNMPYYVKLLS